MRLPDRYRLDGDGSPVDSPVGHLVTAFDGDRRVAIELLRPELAEDPTNRVVYAAEIRRCAGIVHRCLLPLHDLGETPDGVPFVASPAADGALASLGTLPRWSELSAWLDQILEALAHLHARGIVHGSLTPERVWLYRAGRSRDLWVMDPGRSGAANALGLRSGHPRYLAPEQLLDQTNEIGPATDLYAVGVIAWELITGRSPFSGRTSALDSELPPYQPRIDAPPRLETILANLLRADPLSRYDLAADVRTEIAAAADGTITRRPSRDGTVAHGAPIRPAADPIAEIDEVSVAPVRERGPGASPPRWNRPYPPRISEYPPEPPDAGWLPASARVRVLQEVPLYGRDAEALALWEAARRVVEGKRPQIVVICGPRDSGRTALVQWLARGLEESGVSETVWVSYRAPGTPGDGTAGAALALLKPWGESREALQERMLRRLHRERSPEHPPEASRPHHGAARIESEASALAAWCGLGTPDEPAAASGLGMAEVIRHVEARAWRGMSCLVIDDAQWADDESEGLGLVEMYARRVSDGQPAPVLVIATVDGGAFEERPSLDERIRTIEAHGGQRIDLEPLSGTETADLARTMALLADTPAERLAFHHAGRLGTVRQVLVDWAERGWLVEDPEIGAFAVRPEAADDPRDRAASPEDWVPPTVKGVIRRRLTGIARRTGQERRFVDLVHLSALAGCLPRPVFDAFAGGDLIAAALASDLWSERPDGIVLSSGVVSDTACADAQARPDHAYLHRRIGRTIGRLSDGISGVLDAGWHAVQGADSAFGVPWLLRAAARASATGRTSEVGRASRLALLAIDADRELESLRPMALLWLARTHESRGEWSEAAERFLGAAEGLAASDELPLALDALLGLGWARLRAHDFEDADTQFSEVLSHAREQQLPQHEAQALAGKAAVETRRRRVDEAEVLFSQALVCCTQLSDHRGVGAALAGRAAIAGWTGRFDEAEILYHNALDAFRRGRDPLGGIRARLDLAISRRQRTADELTHRMCAWCADRAAEHGAIALEMEARIAIADTARCRGAHDVAAAAYEAASAWADRTDAIEAGIRASLGSARLSLAQGALPDAYAHTRRAADWLGREPGHPLWSAYRLLVAALLARRGEQNQAGQWLSSALEMGAASAIDRDTASCLAVIADAAAAAGWSNVLQLAGKIGAEQLDRLGDEAGAVRLKRHLSATPARP